MVGVYSSDGHALDPCSEMRARELLATGKAAEYRRYPYAIILKGRTRVASVVHAHRLKIDPGSRTTGLAIVQEDTDQVVWAGELTHRGNRFGMRCSRGGPSAAVAASARRATGRNAS